MSATSLIIIAVWTYPILPPLPPPLTSPPPSSSFLPPLENSLKSLGGGDGLALVLNIQSCMTINKWCEEYSRCDLFIDLWLLSYELIQFVNRQTFHLILDYRADSHWIWSDVNQYLICGRFDGGREIILDVVTWLEGVNKCDCSGGKWRCFMLRWCYAAARQATHSFISVGN